MANHYDINDTARCRGEIVNVSGDHVDPGSLTFKVQDPDGNQTSYTYGVDAEVTRESAGIYFVDVVVDTAGQWYYRFESDTPTAAGESTFYVHQSMSIGIELTSSTDLDYLIPSLRLQMGDISEPYTYTQNFLRRALLVGFKLIQPRWNFRYLLAYNASTNNWDVSRNPQTTFVQASPPVILYADERPIILAASIALKSGLVWLVGGDAVTWKDEEIQFSNISGSQMKEAALKRDWEELHQLLPERKNRLAATRKGELVGFTNPPNVYEGE